MCCFSATPFIVIRHAKARGQKLDDKELLGSVNQRAFAQKVLEEELERLRQTRPDLPAILSIEPLNPEHSIGNQGLRPIQFKRFRQKRGDDGGRRAAGSFRITFTEPTLGPSASAIPAISGWDCSWPIWDAVKPRKKHNGGKRNHG